MPAELSAVLTVLAVALVVALHIRTSALSRPLAKLQTDYKDALVLMSQRADKAEKLAADTVATLASFERALAGKRDLEFAVQSLTSQASYLQERLTEMQRANIALANPKAEQIIAAQTLRGKSEPEEQIPQGPSRWQAAEGSWAPKPWWGDKRPLADDLVRASSTFPDYSGLAARESGMHVTPKVIPDPVETA